MCDLQVVLLQHVASLKDVCLCMLVQQLQVAWVDVHSTCDDFHCLSNAFTTIMKAFEDVQDYIVHSCSRCDSCEPGWAGCVCPTDGLVRSGRLESHIARRVLHVHKTVYMHSVSRLSQREPRPACREAHGNLRCTLTPTSVRPQTNQCAFGIHCCLCDTAASLEYDSCRRRSLLPRLTVQHVSP